MESCYIHGTLTEKKTLRSSIGNYLYQTCFVVTSLQCMILFTDRNVLLIL